jgi:hypothetical protein
MVDMFPFVSLGTDGLVLNLDDWAKIASLQPIAMHNFWQLGTARERQDHKYHNYQAGQWSRQAAAAEVSKQSAKPQTTG